MADIESSTSGKKPVKTGGCSMKAKIVGVLAVVLVAAGAAVGIILALGGAGMKGTFADNFNNYVTITEDAWYANGPYGPSYYAISKHVSGMIIMQNSAQAYYPNKWTKIEYHAVTDGYAYCSTVYDGESAEAAESADTSAVLDTADDAKGCNGFPFSVMTAYAFPFSGTYNDDWSNVVTVNETTWESVGTYGTSSYTVLAYGANHILMQNSADNSYNPSLWTKMEVGTTNMPTSFTFCQTVYNGASAEAAFLTSTSSSYDVANSTAGCNGFPHSVATAA
jgi:hypothetical protein